MIEILMEMCTRDNAQKPDDNHKSPNVIFVR